MSSYKLSFNQEFKYFISRRDFVSGLFSFSENVDVNKLKISCELVVELTESFHYIQEDVSALFPILKHCKCLPEITVLNEPNYSKEKFYELIADCIKEENLFKNCPVKFLIVKSDKTYLGIFISSLYADNKSLVLLVDRILTIYLSDKNDFIEEISFLNFSQWQREILEEEVKEENYYWIEESGITDFINPGIFKAFENNTIVNPTPIVRDVFSINKLSFDIHDIIAVIYNSIAQYSDSDNFSLGYIPFERNHDILNQTFGLLNVPLPIRTNYRIRSIEKIKRLSHQIQDLESNRDNFNYSILNQEYLKISVERYDETLLKDSPLGVKQEVYFPYEHNSQIKIILFESDDIVKVQIVCNISAPYLQFIENQIKQYLENFIQYNDVIQTASSQEINFYLGSNWITKEVPNEFLGINKLLADIFKRYPAYPCLTFLENTLTFQQVNSLSNKFANYLSEKYGIKQSDNLGLLLPRGLDQIITLLSVIKTGACFVPLENDWPQFKIELLKKEANLTLIVNDQIIEEFYKTKHLYSDDYDLAPVSDESPLYCIFTSGTTGKPKGCQINNKNFYNYLNWTNEYFKDFPHKKVGYFSPISFDFTLTSIFGSFFSGSNLLISEPDSNLLYNLNQLIVDDEVCVIKITPAHVFLLDENFLKDSTSKTFILGGEALTKEQIMHLRNNQGCKIYNEYGPTEATVGCIVHLIEDDNLPLIGRPIPGTTALIVNHDNDILPIGCKGEILLSGDSIIKNYINDDFGEVSQKFITLKQVNNITFYKTGDLGLCKFDGNLEYLGRIDDQVKIRGYRIELGEIEQALITHQASGQVVVITRVIHNATDKELIAYTTGEATAEELKTHLKERLPSYMVPNYYVHLENIPLTSNGKVDRKALPDPEGTGLKQGEYVAPRTEREKKLVKIWSEVLSAKEEEIGLESDFFALGGDSIKAIQIVARLRSVGYELKILDVMGSFRLQDMAAKLKPLSRKIDQGPVEGEVVLSPIQRAFLTNAFAKGTVAEKQLFHQSFMLRFSGGLKIEETRAIIEKLIAHHDALRMRYQQTEEGEWRQSNGGLQGDYYLLEEASLPGSIKDKQKKEVFFEEQGNSLKQHIGFKEGQLLGVGLYHDTEANESHLLLSIHHMVVDLVSWRILFEDIDSLLNQYRKGKKLTLPEKTDSYRYWMERSKEYAQGHLLERQRRYWEQKQTAKTDTIPVKDPKGNNTFEVSNRVGFVLSKEETALVHQGMNAKNKVETNAMLLAALSRALKSTFRVEQVRVLLEGHGREDYLEKTDISRTVGWFTSVYPFVLDGKQENVESVLLLQDSLTQVPDKGVGYGLLRYLSDEPLTAMEDAQVTFNYLGDLTREVKGGTVSQSTFCYSDYDHGMDAYLNLERECELEVIGKSQDGFLEMNIFYSSERMNSVKMQELVEHYKAQLLQLSQELIQYDKTLQLPGSFTYKGLSLEQIATLSKEYGEIEDVYRLSPMQQGLYYHALSEPKSHAYFEQFGYGLKGALDTAKLEQAYRTLIARHGVLRTVFRNDLAEEPLQVVLKEGIIDFRVEDLSSVSEIEQQQHLQKIAQLYKYKGFDYENENLFRLIVVNLGNSYELIWQQHHLILDGWSNAILMEEFLMIIGNTKKISNSVNKKSNFSNYIKWLEKYNNRKALNYWKNYLDGYDAIAKIPETKNSNLEKEYDRVVQKFTLTKDQSDKLNQFVIRHKFTLNSVFQAVFGYVIMKYSNLEDVVFGSVISGRPHILEDSVELIGNFINTIPVRITLNSSGKLGKLEIMAVQKLFIESEDFQYSSLADIQNSIFNNELVKHLIVFENYPSNVEFLKQNNALEILKANIEPFAQTGNALSLTVLNSDCLSFLSFHNERIYSSALIKRLGNHIVTLLCKLEEDLDDKGHIESFINSEEIGQFNELNPISTHYDQRTVIELFEEVVRTAPKSTAIIFGSKKLSYEEIDEQSNRLANYLQTEYGVNKGDRVSIKLERGIAQVVCVLGVLKAGGAYVPIDIDYPNERIVFMEEDCDSKVIIDEDEWDQFNLQRTLYSSQSPQVQLMPEDAMYVIYTSGSTGVPKGCVLNYEGVSNYLEWVKEYSRDLSYSEVDFFSSLSFDFTVTSLFGALTEGKILRIYDSKEDLSNQIKQIVVNPESGWIKLTPAHINLIDEDTLELARSKVFILGGESLMEEQIKHLRKNKGCRIYNEYGPTEATVGCIVKEIAEDNAPYIGKAIPNTKVFLMDSTQDLVPYGGIGEICIGGVGLARGYLNREELTKEKFITNPYNLTERLYRTGDLGRWREDGNLEYLGRIDDQVKIRGYRIELGEIEQVLTTHPKTGQAVVIASVINNATDKELIAYTTGEATAEELKAYLKDKLPNYMAPNYYVHLKSIPLTSNGKVDRKGLPNPEGTGLKQGEYVAPRTDVEKKLVKIWSEVLGLAEETLSIKANFFDLGGHSLKAMRLMSILNKEFSIKCNISLIFENNSIEEMAIIVESISKQNKSFNFSIRI